MYCVFFKYSQTDNFSKICHERIFFLKIALFFHKIEDMGNEEKYRNMEYDDEKERDMGYEEPYSITSPLNIILFFLDVMIKYFKNTGTN